MYVYVGSSELRRARVTHSRCSKLREIAKLKLMTKDKTARFFSFLTLMTSGNGNGSDRASRTDLANNEWGASQLSSDILTSLCLFNKVCS